MYTICDKNGVGWTIDRMGTAAVSKLSEFLTKELAQSNYRDLETKIGISRGTLEYLIKSQGSGLPKIETLERIAEAYGKPLWEVVQMAGVDLDLPQSPTERSQRLETLVAQVPRLEALALRLQELRDTDPDFVDGMIIGLEASIDQHHRNRRPPPLPEE